MTNVISPNNDVFKYINNYTHTFLYSFGTAAMISTSRGWDFKP